MPTKSLAALLLELGGSNLSCPRTRSSLRMANESLKKAPTQTPAMIVTSPRTTRLATVASEHFRAAVTRGFSTAPSPVSAGLT